MSNVLNNSVEPFYYHREYANDVVFDHTHMPGAPTETPLYQRIACTSLPFLSLYKPLSMPISLTMGSLRIASNLSGCYTIYQQGDIAAVSYQLLQAVIAIVALVGTVLAHPTGMLIATGHDIIIEIAHLASHLQNGEFLKSAEDCANLLNNVLYLGMCVTGGLELSIASIAIQILLNLYHSQEDFKNGKWLEGACHILMAGIRCTQMNNLIQMHALKCKLFEERIKQYESNSEGLSPLLCAIEKQDNEAAMYLLEKQPELAKIRSPGIILMDFHMGSSEKGDYDYDVGITDPGISPLEAAVRNNMSLSLVKRLMTLDPTALALRMEHDGMLRKVYEPKGGGWKYKPNKLIQNPLKNTYKKYSPAYFAYQNNNLKLFELLTANGCNLNETAYERGSYNLPGYPKYFEPITFEKYTNQELLNKLKS